MTTTLEDETWQYQLWMPSGAILDIPEIYLPLTGSNSRRLPTDRAEHLSHLLGVPVTVTQTRTVTIQPTADKLVDPS